MEQLTQEQITLANAALAQRINVIHHAYVDITGDLIAGSLLGQILYWFGAGKDGRSRARIVKEGHTWIAKARGDWYDEIRITPKQYDRAAKILKDKGFIDIKTFKFNGNPTTHIRIVPAKINAALDAWKYEQIKDTIKPEAPPPVAPVGSLPFGNNDLPQEVSPLFTFGEQRNYPDGNNGITQKVITLTETTAETIKENTTKNTHTPTAQPLEGATDAYSSILKGFDEAWSNYPRKEGKQKALRAYERAIKSQNITHAEILAEVILFRQYVMQRVESGELERRYIPTGGAWFEGERWNDETPSISSTFDDMLDGINHNRAVGELRRCASVGELDRLREVAAQMPY